jgi:hypothetical protein
MKSATSSGFIEKHVPGFKVKHMPSIADDVFEKFLDAHRKGDLSGLSYHATEGLYQSIAAEFAAAKKKGAAPRRAFRLLGMKESTYVLQMRYAMRKVINISAIATAAEYALAIIATTMSVNATRCFVEFEALNAALACRIDELTSLYMDNIDIAVMCRVEALTKDGDK